MTRELSDEERERAHKTFACECNNSAWSLSELALRTPQQDDEMLHFAHAAAYHWNKIGSEINAARANMLLGHVHAAVGSASLAMRYAQSSFDYLLANGAPDWEAAFAHAVLAHALWAAGETDKHREHYLNAEALGNAIADAEDKEIFFKTFVLIPRPRNEG